MKKIPAFVFALILLACQSVFSKDSSSGSENLERGYDAYKMEDWTSAVFYLKKAVASPQSATEENYFMLIKSEIFAGEYKQAQSDCELFLEQYSFSRYTPYIKYQNGRLLHLLGKNEKAILFLSDFCHEYQGDELYPLALFWVAESFYDEYNFDSARGIYTRIVSDFSSSDYAADAEYKLALIDRRNREEKLLYLLKVTGEENLSTREEYERQIKIYEAEDKIGLKKQLVEAQSRITELETIIASDEQAKKDASDKYRADIEKLRLKAQKIQFLIEERNLDSEENKSGGGQ